MKIRLISVLSAVAVFCVFSTPASAGPNLSDPVVLTAPCAPTDEAAKSGPMAGFKTCKAFFNGETGRPGLLANLKSLVKTQVDKITTGPVTGVQACVLAPNPFITKDGQPFPEERFNRFGQSCGNPMTVTIQTHPLVVQFRKEPPLTGTQEDGWIAGAQIQAVAFYHAQVSTEIASTRKFTVRPYSHGPSYVASMARDYLDLLNSRNNLFSIISARNDTKELLAAVADCKKTEDGTDTTLTFTVGQQAAQLCSAQMSLERAYLNIAAADVMGRAEDSFYTNLGSDTAYQAMLTWIQNTMKMVCKDAGQNGANQCYRDNIASKMRDYIRGVWPLSATASATSTSTQARMELTTPWFLMASGLRRRKRLVKSRRRKARPRAGARSIRRLLRPLCLAFLVAVGGAVVSACNGGSVNQNTPTQLINGQTQAQRCPWGAPQYLPECCSDQGTLCSEPNMPGCHLPPGASCQNANQKTGGQTQASIVTGSDDMNVSRASLDNARVLLGIPTDAVGVGSPDGAVRSAALAGGAQLGSHGDQPTDGTTPDSGKQSSLVATGGNGSGSDENTKRSGSQSGSNSNLFGSGTGLALPGGGAQNGAGSVATAGTDGKVGAKGTTYGGGGGKATAENGNVDPNSFFGDLNGGDRNPAGQDTVFGKGDATQPMGTADPDDYFTRVGLDDSIFKIVSRRYRAKAFSWASVQSQASFQEASQAAAKR